MEFPNWPYTQSPNMTLHEDMYDQQLHSCGNYVPSSSNWCNPEENFQITQSMADFWNPGELDQVFPMQSSPDLVTIQYDSNFNLSSWHNEDPGTQNHLRYSGEATWETPENPLFYIPGEATWENPQKTEFSVCNFLSQSDLDANYSQLEPPQFPNCIQSSENCFPFATDAFQEYDGVSMISSDLEKLVNSVSSNMNHSVEASKTVFSDMICMENELEETLSQISRETNPGGSIVTTINDHSGMVNNFAGNNTQDVLAEFLNPEVEFRHALEDHHPDIEEARWVKATELSGMDFSEPGSSQRASVEEHSQDETTMISPMKEMMYCAAALKPVNLHHEVVEKDQKPKRKNVRISSDPQTVAARQRRERINERLKMLKKLVPGGGKLDTASMLEEAANYLKFLKAQIKALEDLGHRIDNSMTCMPMNLMFSTLPFYHSFPMGNNISLYQLQNHMHYFHQPQD